MLHYAYENGWSRVRRKRDPGNEVGHEFVNIIAFCKDLQTASAISENSFQNVMLDNQLRVSLLPKVKHALETVNLTSVYFVQFRIMQASAL